MNRARVFLHRVNNLKTPEEHLEQHRIQQAHLSQRLRSFLGFDPSTTPPPILPPHFLIPRADSTSDKNTCSQLQEADPWKDVCKDKLTEHINQLISKKAYFIERTNYGRALPVYTRYRHSRQQRYTVIRHIHGDVNQLVRELRTLFPPEHVLLKERKRHVYVKGVKDLELKYWLADQGF